MSQLTINTLIFEELTQIPQTGIMYELIPHRHSFALELFLARSGSIESFEERDLTMIVKILNHFIAEGN